MEAGVSGNDADGDRIDHLFDVDETNGVDANGDGVDDDVIGADTDRDGVPDSVDPDVDGDGIPDSVEGSNDSDGDAIPDKLDTDSDNNGVPDSVEAAVSAQDADGDGIDDTFDVGQTGGTDANGDGIDDDVTGADTDGDGIPDSVDADNDGDGVPDSVEGTDDVDNDGLGNYLDADSDNDGINDGVEAGVTGNDSDGDGIDDLFDVDETGGVDANSDGVDDSVIGKDTDADGIPDGADLDADGDGIPDRVEGQVDSDGNGLPDNLDPDSDNDGVPDGIEAGVSGKDADGDGIDDSFDVDQTGGSDANGDGIDDTVFGSDTDGDGIPDSIDKDTDGDGIPDIVEGLGDLDGDGIPDNLDTDSDNDGISDGVEAGVSGIDTDGDDIDDAFDVDQTGGSDANGDGIDDSFSGSDTDGDGTPDSTDLDADGDSIPDTIEGNGDTDADGIPDYLDSDADGDGISDFQESTLNGVVPADKDQDGIFDYLDLDSDNDGISDEIEGGGDLDGDGVANYRDLDVDSDGISDLVEMRLTLAEVVAIDKNLDGVIDLNFEVGNNGMADVVETEAESGIENYVIIDHDNDSVFDYRDHDSDNDGILDTIESNSLDENLDGKIDVQLQSDAPLNGDSVLYADPVAGESPPDTDGDSLADFRDQDSDNDGILDSVEAFGSEMDADRDGQIDDFLDADGDGVNDRLSDYLAPATDTDGNGKPDSIEIDSDRDGIADIVENGGVDQDGDGQVDNFSDADSDGVDDGVAVLPPVIVDSDADGSPDFQDRDSDNDGVSDLVESGGVDADGDGNADVPLLGEALPDQNSDGIPDYQQTGVGNFIRTGLSGSGCSIGVNRGKGIDPLFLLLSLSAVFYFVRRVRNARLRKDAAVGMGILLTATIALSSNVQADPSRYSTDGDFLDSALLGGTSFSNNRPAGWYLGMGLGVSSLKPETGEVEGWSIHDSSDVGAQLTLGLDLSPRTSIEMHAAELGSVSLSPLGSIGYSMYGASGLFYIANKDKRIHPTAINAFGRLGVGYLKNHAEDGVIFVNENRTHVMYGVGLEYSSRSRSRFGLRAEIIAYDTDAKLAQLALLYRFGKASKRSKQEGILASVPASLEAPLNVAKAVALTDEPSKTNLTPPTLAAALPSIMFEFDAYALSLDTQYVLDNVASTLIDNKGVSIVVSGHADSVGSDEYNVALSQRRADSVVRYLKSKGISMARMHSVAYGESSPVQFNGTDAGRAINRRVEIDVAQ